jgi:hypothetical protein
MMVIDKIKELEQGLNTPPTVKIRILEQMAEALEDQVAGLYRRAAAFEEEEFLLNREVEDRQTEINRLLLKLESMRAERDRVMERIDTISNEVAAIREEVFKGEEEVAIASIERSEAPTQPLPSPDSLTGATFFRRLSLVEQGGQV